MKPARNASLRAALASATIIVATQALHGADGTWNVNAAGDWGTAANWLGNTIADGSGSTANFTFNITADRTVTLNTSRTITGVKFEDITTASNNWTLAASGGSVLTLAGFQPTINAVHRTATISAPIAGTTAWAKTGVGILVLSAANTFNAGVTIANGTLQLNNNTAAGTGTISLVPGGTAGTATRLLLNGGVTIANPVTVEGALAGAAGQGPFQQTGTGQARVNGAITIKGAPAAGGHFVGGNAVGNELVLSAPINSTIASLSQRDGRVVYAGGGTGGSWTNLTATNTVIVGATNGIPTGVSVLLGGSGSATLDLNGFDQALAGLTLGNTGASNNFVSTISLGANTLTLNGNITSQSAATQTVTHLINATAGGAIDVGATQRTLTLPDTAAFDDLLITNAAINGSGGLLKAGAGTMTVNNATVAGPLVINDGGLATGLFTNPTATTLTTGALTFGANPTTLRMKVGAAGDLINAGTLTTNGTTTITLNQHGGLLAPGTYPLLAYTGTSPGLTGFALNPLGHSDAALFDTGTAIAVKVTTNDSIFWTGALTNDWAVGDTDNWKLTTSPAVVADYIEGDVVFFPDAPFTDVTIPANVTPSAVTFTNTVASPYTLSGAGGIIGTTGLTKNGNGSLTIRTPNPYTGATAINDGTLELDATTGTITASSGVSVAPGTTFRITRDGTATNTNTTFSRNLSGGGNLDVNMRDTAGTTAADGLLLTGDNSGFSGPIRLLAPAEGTYRLQITAPTQLGTGNIEVQSGAQVFVDGANTYTNNITIAGIGYKDANANIGALRVNGGAIWAGNVSVDAGGARIGSHSSTGTISGNISGGNLEFHVTNYNNSYTTILTGTNSYGTTTIGGGNTQTGGVPSMRVNIGAGGTTGTLGTGAVTINGDGANGVLGFDRSDGYTLLPGQTITGGGTNLARTFLDLECTGTGFNDNGNTITLGTAAPAAGGRVRLGQSRANTITTLSGTLTTEILQLAGGQNNATLNLASGANITANQFHVGESANNSGTVNHPAGATVNVVGQLRLGHFGTNTSTYNLTGGTLTMTGATPNASPSTAGGGAANTYGDNNLNTLAVNTILGGGVYLGNDGTGIMNHSAGTLTTNWIVLDNRGATGPGTNMPDGIDRYNLSGTALLKLRSTYGLIGRNDGSYDVSLGGGTIQVDNTGTGTGTGADLTIPLDAILTAVPATTTTLDTNGATNAFTLTKHVTGTGTLALTGLGTVNLSTTTFQQIDAALTGSLPLVKLGAGTTTLAGSLAGYAGNVTVSAGRLNVPASLTTSVTVDPAGTLSGEIALASLTMNGGTLLFDPATAGSLSATSLTLTGSSLLNITSPPGPGTFTAIDYGSVSGVGTLAVVNAADYRTAPTVTDTTSTIDVTFGAGKTLTWTGNASGVWDLKTAVNWTDGVNPETFYQGDTVIFPEGGLTPAVTLTGSLAPFGVSVTSDTTNYTLTSTASNQITGGTGLSKSGTSTLTLAGPNNYDGANTVSGGIVAIDGTNSIGSGNPGNGIALSGGASLAYTGATAIDLGLYRSLAVGTGGGTLAHANATAAAITIPGNLSGTGNLTVQSELAGGGTFNLTGSNAGYSGAISIGALSTGLTTLTLANQAAVPAASSITVNYPPAGVAGNANTLNLQSAITLGAGTTINMTSFLTAGNVSQRSQITTTTNSTPTINGPITLAGTSIIQCNAAAGSTVTYNGNIVETAPGSFIESTTPANPYSNVFFFRGAGTHIVNGQINLPSTGSTISVTDGPTMVLNSTGNVFNSAAAVYGTLRIGATNAIPTSARLVIGQAGNQNCTLDLNGFDQTVTDLLWQATTASINKGISNSHLTNTSTFTINQLAAPAVANFSGTFTGAINLVKDGPATTTLSTALSTYTGNVTVKAGQLTIAAGHNDTNANSALGVTDLGTRTVTVESGATLAFTGNDNLGNAASSPVLPIIVEAGGVLTNSGFNTMGPVTLNGATMTATGGANANYQSYRLFGTVTAGGAAASVMSASGTNSGYHLHSTTAFNVANATADAAADLIVSAPLLNQSGTQGGAAGNLVKDGIGTMTLDAATNPYTGTTAVNQGTLLVNGDTSGSSFTVAPGATLGGTGSVGALAAAGIVAPGTSIGTLGAASATLTSSLSVEVSGATADRLNVAGALDISTATLNITEVTPATGSILVIASYGSLVGSQFATVNGLPDGYTINYNYNSQKLIALIGSLTDYDSWAGSFSLDPLTNGAPGADADNDGLTNGEEYAFGLIPTSGASVSPISLPLSKTGGTFKYTRRLPSLTGLTYSYQYSTSLGSWNPLTPASTATNNGTPVEEITVTVPAALLTNPNLFVRVLAN